MSGKIIRWLHLSDFHVGKDDYGQSQLFNYILESVHAKVEASEGPDLVFITGDIANKGLADQYALFGEKFLKPLRQCLPSDSAQRIFIVPGNHDVDRAKAKAVETHGVLSRVPQFLDPTDEGLSERKVILERFEAFANCDVESVRDHWLFSQEGAYWETLDLTGYRIGIVGINTAWLSFKDEERHQLSAGKPIIETALERLGKCDVRIILGHHPIDWFLDDEVEPVRSLFGKHSVLYLHGHLHKHRTRPDSGAGNPFQIIQAGAAFQDRENDIWVNRFLWCALDLKHGQIFAEPLKWSKDNQEWAIDSGAFPQKLKVEGQDLWAIPLPGHEALTGSSSKVKTSTDSAETEPQIWNVPHSRNPHFTGREELLANLREQLTSGRAAALTQPAAICGLGGVGKTQLAIEYACRHRESYSIIWWVRADDPAQMASDYAQLAASLNLPVKDDPDQPLVVSAVREWLRRNDRWLLIFDNAEKAEDVHGFIPESNTGHVIITSRNPAWRGIGAEPFSVDVMAPDEAIELLLRRSGQGEEVAAEDLARELGYLPLALEQAAAYMEVTGTGFREYLDLFRERGTEIFKHAPKNRGYPDSVATTWDISFKAVERVSSAAAQMLTVFAFLAPDNIPRDLLQKGVRWVPKPLADACGNKLEFKFTVGALRRYSLIDVRPEGFSVHRLVQAVMRDRLSMNDRKKWGARAVSVVEEAFPGHPDSPRTWHDCAFLLPHALAAAEHAQLLEVAAGQTGSLLNQIGIFLFQRAEFGPAARELQRALEIRERAFGPKHPDVAGTLSNLGVVLRELGRFEEAKKKIERALAIEKRVLGPDHPLVATGLSNLGTVLGRLGRFEEAREKFDAALTINRKVFGDFHPSVATILGNLGSAMRGLGRLEEAQEKHELALAIRQKLLGPDHPDVADSLISLGNVMLNLGRFEEAKKNYGLALKIMNKLFGREHPRCGMILNNMGFVTEHQGLIQEAKEKYEEALQIVQRILGDQHPDTKMVRGNLDRIKLNYP